MMKAVHALPASAWNPFDSIDSYMKHIGREDKISEIEKLVSDFANMKQ